MSIGSFILLGFIAWLYLGHSKKRRKSGRDRRSDKETYDLHAEVILDGLKRRYLIQYLTYEGERTLREVDVHTLLGRWKGKEPYIYYLRGYCHLRHEPRTFLVNRIACLTDLTTGEVFEEQKWIWDHFKELAGYHSDEFLLEFDPAKRITVHVSNGFIFEYDLQSLEQTRNFLRARGDGRRIDGKRKWQGAKAFYENNDPALAANDVMPVKIDADGVSYANFHDYLNGALGGNPKLKLRQAA